MQEELKPLMLSVDETALVLGLSSVTVLKLTKTGDIPSLRMGRRILIPRHEVSRLVGREV
jgi:excisionase family DNA binding protein